MLSGENQTLPNYNCQRQKQCVAIIAGNVPTFSSQIGTLLELYKSPHVTYGPFDPILSKDRFPSVYHMATQDRPLAHGITWLLLHFDWTWIALYVADGMQGEASLQDLKAEMIKKEICVDFTERLPATTGGYVLYDFNFIIRIRISSANVYIILGDEGSVWSLIMAEEFYLILGKVLVIRNLFSSKWEDVLAANLKQQYIFHGSLLFSNKKRKIPGFKQFLKRVNSSQYPEDFVLSKLWIESFNCSLSGSLCGKIGDCPPNSSLEFIPSQVDMMTLVDSSFFIYNAVYMVAQALHQIFSQKIEMGYLGDSGQSVLPPWQVNTLYNQDIYLAPDNIGGSVCIRNDSNVTIYFNMTQINRLRLKQLVFVFPTDAEQCMQCPDQEYPNSEKTHCLPKSVTFLAFEDSMGMAMACTALCFSTVTAVVLGVFVKHQNTPIVKANNHVLSFILLISLLLCFLCSLLFIGHPNTVTCILQQVTFALVFTVAISTVLAKTITVILAFKARKPGRTMKRLLLSGTSNSVIPICSLVQVIICGIWLGTSPPFIDIDLHSEPTNLIIMCNKGSVTAFYCVLGYLGFLALGSFTVAFLARNLPDTFNEAKFLTFSMLVFCSVWVTFLPVYHSTKGKFMVAVEVFSILASSAGLLCCIFIPKCYIILIRPERNSLQSLKKQKRFQTKQVF
ncbi:Vomeronasal type-2 receptor 26 [Tupaia chinensis]|uniref:Vomeronasal type-2 receptor 26 n=1 Tax=Tupaia chinensis TaxID=246437 RepID=L8YC25_TUPCH|nr:Vomeronasal type-2 receptor 26 [Tupaia chinensis]